MAVSIASPAAIVCPSRRQDQTNFRSSLSIIGVLGVSSSSKLCSFIGNPRITKDIWLKSFSAKGSHFLPSFLCSVSCEVDGLKEEDATKQRLKYGIAVKSPESTAGQVLDTQNSISSEQKKMSRKERNPKRLNSCASPRNRVSYFQVIRYPLISESAMANILRHNTLVFVVHENADKKSIRDAAKKLFKIETKKINTLIMPDGTKKAYLVLTPNLSAIDVAKKIKVI